MCVYIYIYTMYIYIYIHICLHTFCGEGGGGGLLDPSEVPAEVSENRPRGADIVVSVLLLT